MERLTKSGVVSQKDINELMELSNENQFGPNNAYYKLKHYEDLGLEPSDIAYLMNFYKEHTTGKAIALDLKLLGDSFELERYKKLEEEGRLLQGCRCKNCKHVDYSGCKGATVYCEYLERYMQEDDFCSRGEYDEQALAEMQKG